MPYAGFGNKVPLLLPDLPRRPSGDSKAEWKAWTKEVDRMVEEYKYWAVLLLANFNTIVFDFVARQKVHGQTLNLYIVEQLPVLPEEAYSRRIGERDAASMVREEVLKLTYTAHDMEPFARDMGHDGTPFAWDEDERRHSRARLDALYFLLYGVTDRDDVAYARHKCRRMKWRANLTRSIIRIIPIRIYPARAGRSATVSAWSQNPAGHFR